MQCRYLLVSFMLVAGCSVDGDQPRTVNSALGGTVSGPVQNAEDEIAVQEALIQRQEEELRRQARELQDLKRQEYHNQRLRAYEKR